MYGDEPGGDHEPATVASPFGPPLRVVLGVLAAVVATRAMARLPEGETPPAVAAAVLTDRRVGEGPPRLAAV